MRLVVLERGSTIHSAYSRLPPDPPHRPMRRTARAVAGKTSKGRPVTQENLHPLIYWTHTGESYIDLGSDTVNLHTAAKAAIGLAEVVQRVGNVISRRRYRTPNRGSDPAYAGTVRLDSERAAGMSWS
jgi:hypothetical protein